MTKPSLLGWVNQMVQRVAPSRFLTVSLLLHIVLMAALGTVVLFKARAIEDGFEVSSVGGFIAEEAAEEPPAEDAMEFEEPGASSASEQQVTTSPQSFLAVSTESSFQMPAVPASIEMSNGTFSGQAMAVSKGGGPGGNGSGLGTGSGRKMGGSLFGVSVQSAKLGVVLDVSQSAHPHLIHALKELRNFEQATVVLFPGCGMQKTADSRDYKITGAMAVAKRFESESKSMKTVFGQIGLWIETNPHDATAIKTFLNTPTVYVSVNKPNAHLYQGCQHALDYLIGNGVDTIYWFADFADKINEEVADDLIAAMEARKIKLIAHNFTGAPVNDAVKRMVRETGGKSISQVPR